MSVMGLQTLHFSHAVLSAEGLPWYHLDYFLALLFTCFFSGVAILLAQSTVSIAGVLSPEALLFLLLDPVLSSVYIIKPLKMELGCL